LKKGETHGPIDSPLKTRKEAGIAFAIASLLNFKSCLGAARMYTGHLSGSFVLCTTGSARRPPVPELPERQVLYTRKSYLPSGITS
jgi:hypothetical protein